MFKSRFCIYVIILGSLLPVAVQGQTPDRKGKFFLVPELWISFGTRTYIDVAPQVGYHIFDRWSVGIGPHYIFQSQKATAFYPYSYQTHAYGAKIFTRFALITNADQLLPIPLFSDLFAHVEYEGISLEKAYFYSPTYPDEGRFIYQGFLVGGGFTQKVGIYNSISLMVLWDLNESSRSPYTNPVFRIGFSTYF